jgi:hypothetical protein
MAEGTIAHVGGEQHYGVAFTIASGAAATAELDLGESGASFGIEITSTDTLTALTLFNVTASSTAGGTKRTLQTSTGGAVSLSIASGGICVGLNQAHNEVLRPWRFIVLNTTANTTAAMTGIVNVRNK